MSVNLSGNKAAYGKQIVLADDIYLVLTRIHASSDRRRELSGIRDYPQRSSAMKSWRIKHITAVYMHANLL